MRLLALPLLVGLFYSLTSCGPIIKHQQTRMSTMYKCTFIRASCVEVKYLYSVEQAQSIADKMTDLKHLRVQYKPATQQDSVRAVG